MAFQQPNYNITVNIWRWNLTPLTQPPSVADAEANFAWGKRVSSMSTGGTGSAGVIVTTSTLLLASSVDIRDQYMETAGDQVEVPSGSGRFYRCMTADFIGYGFPNEHKGAVLMKMNGFKKPDTH